MPELGPYAGAVLSAYLVSLVLLAGLVLRTIRRNAAARARLDELERKD